jgi:hypothetical protein
VADLRSVVKGTVRNCEPILPLGLCAAIFALSSAAVCFVFLPLRGMATAETKRTAQRDSSHERASERGAATGGGERHDATQANHPPVSPSACFRLRWRMHEGAVGEWRGCAAQKACGREEQWRAEPRVPTTTVPPPRSASLHSPLLPFLSACPRARRCSPLFLCFSFRRPVLQTV